MALSEPRGADPALIAGPDRGCRTGERGWPCWPSRRPIRPDRGADRLSEPRGSDPALLAALDRLSGGAGASGAMAEALAPAAGPDGALIRGC